MTSTLALDYAFTPSPNPIRCSPSSGNPNVIDLEVIVTNPKPQALALRGIVITIPVGKEGGHTLSTEPSLTPPSTQPPGWTVACSGSDVTIRPTGSDALAGSIVFTLPAIPVDETPGVVPIMVQEILASGVQNTDPNTYSVVKQPADYAITSFVANPPILYNIDQQPTLTWAVQAPEGEKYVFELSGDNGWRPTSCLAGGSCLTVADGQAGVQSNRLQESTTFTLEAIGTDHDGNRVVVASASTCVRVAVPAVLQNSYAAPLQWLSGRLVSLHWAAINASRCSVFVGTTCINDAAPVDTYEDGYLVGIGGPPGTYQLSIVAHAAIGIAQASFPFTPAAAVAAPATIPVAGSSTFTGLGAGGNRAIAATAADGLTVVDLDHRALVGRIGTPGYTIGLAFGDDGLDIDYRGGDFGVGEGLNWSQSYVPPMWLTAGVAVAPDGSHAAAVTHAPVVSAIDAQAGKLGAGGYGPVLTLALAATPDGTKVLAVGVGATQVYSLPSMGEGASVNPTNIGLGTGIAMAADGRSALVTDLVANLLWRVDVASAAPADDPVTVGGAPQAVAITPDGATALVACAGPTNGGLYRVAFGPGAPAVECLVGGAFAGVAVSPDGRWALATDRSAVHVVDLAAGKAVTQFAAGRTPSAVQWTAGGVAVLVDDTPGARGFLIL